MIRKMKWLTLLGLALLGVTLFTGCGDEEGSTVTAPSSPSATLADFDTTAARSHSDDSSSSDDPSSDDPSDDPSDDDSSDDESSDDESSDDDSDDDSSDADGFDDASGGDDVRGLFFGFAECSECVLAVRVKDTVVVVTENTRVDNEPALAEGLPPGDLQGLLSGHLGLPMRAEGSSNGGVLVASRIRIDDEIRASGVVVADGPGCDVSLRVRETTDLCFVFAVAGLPDPAVGVAARIEGVVPANFDEPYQATTIELVN